MLQNDSFSLKNSENRLQTPISFLWRRIPGPPTLINRSLVFRTREKKIVEGFFINVKFPLKLQLDVLLNIILEKAMQ